VARGAARSRLLSTARASYGAALTGATSLGDAAAKTLASSDTSAFATVFVEATSVMKALPQAETDAGGLYC
jgi:hypothetical protein